MMEEVSQGLTLPGEEPLPQSFASVRRYAWAYWNHSSLKQKDSGYYNVLTWERK